MPSNDDKLVVKLMSDVHAWKREIYSRSIFGETGVNVVVPVLSAAEIGLDGAVHSELEDCPCPLLLCDEDVIAKAPWPIASELMTAYPYAITMPMADRNL